MNAIHFVIAAVLGLGPQAGKPAAEMAQPTAKKSWDGKQISEEQKILHVLNRLGFGPRPGDVERVKKMGLKAYIDQQLHPEKIADEAVENKTSAFEMLKLNGTEIAEMERAVQMNNGRLLRLQAQMAQRGATEGSAAIQKGISAAQTGSPPPPNQQRQNALEVMRNATPEERKMLEDGRMARLRVNDAGTQLVMNKLVRAVESEKQLYEVMVDFWSNHFNIDATKVRASKLVDEQQVIRPYALGKFKDLLNASATSAAMMIYLDNQQSVAPQNAPQRPFARQGTVSFDQLKAGAERGLPVAKQMLERIQERAKADNITEEEAFKRFQRLQGAGQTRGLNENYARELMELHTLGVDGGYTQKDVTEVARCLTGWGVRGGRYSGEFEFHPQLHDRGEKTVLGKTIPAGGGMEDGKTVLEMLASHPSTMKFISTKLCRRLVADDPPASLVEKCVATWKKTDGDIREIVHTIVTSPEFYSRSAYKSKIKSPFEYVVSAVRAIGGSVSPQPAAQGPGGFRPIAAGLNVFAANGNGQTNPRILAGQIGLLGQPLFNYGFPTGYPEESTKWVSAGALIGRINFALSLVNGRIADVDASGSPFGSLVPDTSPVPKQVDAVAKTVLGTDLSPATRATLIKQLAPESDGAPSTVVDTRRIASLIIGSPDFQRR